jgi:hypothetical protein
VIEQRNFTFSTEKPRVGVKAAASGGTPPPPTLTTEDLLLQGDESWSGSFGSATQKQQPATKKDDLAPPVLLATPVASATPVIAPLPPKHTAFAARPPARRSRNSSFMDIITWTDPVKSAIVFGEITSVQLKSANCGVLFSLVSDIDCLGLHLQLRVVWRWRLWTTS